MIRARLPTMLTRLSATALLVLAAPTAQSLQARAQDPQSAAWLRFVQQNSDSWVADWNKATGTPAAIWGPGLRVEARPITSIARARAHANAVLDQHAQLLGLGASRFVERIASKQRRVYMFVYDQTFAGLPVIGGRADVRVHDVGVVSMFGSQAVPIAAGFSTTR